MPVISPATILIGLDLLMIAYTLWAISPAVLATQPIGKTVKHNNLLIAAGMLAWLTALHLGLSNQALFPADISGTAFLGVIFAAVGAVAALLLLLAPLRRLLLSLQQRQLMLLQGIRVFYGATFLMFASSGALPQTFGILDGYTHIGAGFLGLIAAVAVSGSLNGRRWLWFANLFGLADILVVASTLALILLPQIGPHHPMMYAVFLPAPLWLCFHLISIGKLLSSQAEQQPSPLTSATATPS